ncbi:hypothetical protein BKA66DRAFT_52255 [Pyrenochaeta sp. MPI-SDFR-AT-0127]|nr:hypothetical protein BKA66DRAFT_52255 [Pyrenochaeta sp. MPI-SDFR-AT-0127]
MPHADRWIFIVSSLLCSLHYVLAAFCCCHSHLDFALIVLLQPVCTKDSYIASLHELNDIKSWPEVIPVMETGEQRAFLDPSKAKMWRTCWSGQYVTALNSAYHSTMAITFVKLTIRPLHLKTFAPIQAPPRKDDSDKDNIEGKNKGKDMLKPRNY